MAEAGECLLTGDYARNQRHQQGAEGDDVVAPAAPYEKREHEAQQREEEYLIRRHTARPFSRSVGKNAGRPNQPPSY
jgi:hypothetical protein